MAADPAADIVAEIAAVFGLASGADPA